RVRSQRHQDADRGDLAAVGERAAGLDDPAVAVARPHRLAEGPALVEQPRAQTAARVLADDLHALGRLLAVLDQRVLAAQERLALVPGITDAHLGGVGLCDPIADQ